MQAPISYCYIFIYFYPRSFRVELAVCFFVRLLNTLYALNDILRPVLHFKEEDSVSDIWEVLLEKKEHISVILDEYGSLRGIVTMEDVIETMLGHEIVDEKDEVVDMQEYAKEQWEKAQKEMLQAE